MCMALYFSLRKESERLSNYKTNCVDSRNCFAKRGRGDGTFGCSILETDKPPYAPYKDGKCPFCKPAMAVTNGRYYPYIPPVGR